MKQQLKSTDMKGSRIRKDNSASIEKRPQNESKEQINTPIVT